MTNLGKKLKIYFKKRGTLTIVLLTLMTLSFGSLQAHETQPQPSSSTRMVEVLGGSTRVMTVGIEGRDPGEPVLIFQSGALVPIEYVGPMIPLMSGIAPLVAYDRPGIGESPFDGIDQTPERVVEHLHELLHLIKVPPPYILVGYSWGGPLILYYAGTYPDEVVGMVYLDPTDPEETVEDFYMTSDKDELVAMQAERNDFMIESLKSNPGALAEYKVIEAFQNSAVEDRKLPEHPRVPTAFLLATLFENPAGFSFMNETWHNKMMEKRINRFVEYTQALPQATLILATDVTHTNIPFTAQDLVAQAIQRVKMQISTPLPKAPVKRTEIDISEEILMDYVGEYELTSEIIFTISAKDNNLFAQITGQPTNKIYPESESKFFLKGVDAQISFVRNTEGKVTHLILHQSGIDQKAYKRDKPGVSLEVKDPKFDADVFRKYVGRYSLAPGVEITVTFGESTLMVQITGQPSLPVYSESETRFFYKLVDARIEFKINPDGDVEGLTLFQLGQETFAKKI